MEEKREETKTFGALVLLGKSGLVFPKLTNVTIHINSTLNGNCDTPS